MSDLLLDTTAASVLVDTFSAYGADFSAGRPTRVQARVQVRRIWSATAPGIGRLTVTVPFPASFAAGGPATAVTGAGWTAGPVGGSAGTEWTYTFAWTGNLDNAWQSTPELAFRVDRLAVERANVDITAFATAPGAAPGSRTVLARV